MQSKSEEIKAVEWLKLSISPDLYIRIKRVVELALILCLLPILAVTCVIIVIAIKIDSSGSAIYRQERIGFRGKKFILWKFRSMVVNDDKEARFTDKNDKRITLVGKMLRRFRLDELPQLWNVVQGDMSLIGPRPEQPKFAERFNHVIPFYDYRHTIRPGITGWAQVMYGYATTEEQAKAKLEFDLYYIKHMSAWLDIVILMKTLHTIVVGSGVR